MIILPFRSNDPHQKHHKREEHQDREEHLATGETAGIVQGSPKLRLSVVRYRDSTDCYIRYGYGIGFTKALTMSRHATT